MKAFDDKNLKTERAVEIVKSHLGEDLEEFRQLLSAENIHAFMHGIKVA